MEKEKVFNTITQFAIPIFTLGSQIVLSFKYPQWALLLNLLSQPFWLYSTWKSYKKVGQIGMFINTIAFTAITMVGLVNYWILK